jgi:hypothetical protein
MNTPQSSVSRYVVCESGTGEVIYDRRYIVEVPDDMDVQSLDGERLSEAADEAGLGWEMPDLFGPYHEGYVVEGLADEAECDGLPVISMTVPKKDGVGSQASGTVGKDTDDTCAECGGQLRRCEADECCDYECVRRIIEDAITQSEERHVSKSYVLETIKLEINCIHLFNKALEKECATNNGKENVHRGAQKMLLDAMRVYKDRFIVHKDGWITKR